MKYLVLLLISVPAFGDVIMTKTKLVTVHFNGADLTETAIVPSTMNTDHYVAKLVLDPKFDLTNSDIIAVREDDTPQSSNAFWVSATTSVDGTNVSVQFNITEKNFFKRKFHITFAVRN